MFLNAYHICCKWANDMELAESDIWDHSYSTVVKFSEKLTSVRKERSVRNGVRNVSFLENFANLLNEWSL